MEKVDINAENAVERAVAVLEAGGVVMHPTETCYGFAVDIFNEEALKKLYALKGRDFDKPVSILVDGMAMAEKFGEFSSVARELAEKYWPGALSIVVPRKAELPDFLNPGMDGVSMRHSSHDFCTAVVRALGRPVTTTSANVAGQPELYEVDLSSFEGEIDLVVDGGRLEREKPSTVVLVKGEEVKVLREGGISM